MTKFTPVLLGLFALALSACGGGEEAPPAPVEEAAVPGSPAIWSFSDDDTTVYLFGTVHLLKPETEWRSEEIDAAFDAADTIYFEADVQSEAAGLEALRVIGEYGVYQDGGSLSAALTDEEEREVAEAAEALGVSMSALETNKPWWAAVQLAQIQIISQGYAPDSGVEVVFSREAEAQGKDVGFFESVREQLLFFGEMPEDEQIEFLVSGAEQIEEDPRMLDRLVLDWAEGDVAGISDAMSEPEALGSELLYERLIVQRNENWVPQIEGLLEEPGVKFVAVGAAHLAGEDSVVTMLRAKGYQIDGP